MSENLNDKSREYLMEVIEDRNAQIERQVKQIQKLRAELDGTEAALRLVKLHLAETARDFARAKRDYYSIMAEQQDFHVDVCRQNCGINPEMYKEQLRKWRQGE